MGKLKLILNGKVRDIQGGTGGTYLFQEGKTNEKNYWVHQNNHTAIWWDKKFEKWKIGFFKDLGSSAAFIKGPSNNDNPPTLITEGWKYYDGSDWPKAEENDVIFEDWSNAKSKFLKDKNYAKCCYLFSIMIFMYSPSTTNQIGNDFGWGSQEC